MGNFLHIQCIAGVPSWGWQVVQEPTGDLGSTYTTGDRWCMNYDWQMIQRPSEHLKITIQKCFQLEPRGSSIQHNSVAVWAYFVVPGPLSWYLDWYSIGAWRRPLFRKNSLCTMSMANRKLQVLNADQLPRLLGWFVLPQRCQMWTCDRMHQMPSVVKRFRWRTSCRFLQPLQWRSHGSQMWHESPNKKKQVNHSWLSRTDRMTQFWSQFCWEMVAQFPAFDKYHYKHCGFNITVQVRRGDVTAKRVRAKWIQDEVCIQVA